MGDVSVRALDRPTAAEVAELAVVFDAYRAGYGEVIEAGASARWLADNVAPGRLVAFIAAVDAELIGFATTLDMPASLRLGRYWQVRDLFVVPARRRSGIASALLHSIGRSASLAGALRLSVQTEHDNDAARRLYEAIGFVEVEGYVGLTLAL